MINHKNIFIICFVLLSITITFDFLLGIHFAWYLLSVTFLFLAIAVGSFNISYNFFLNSFSNRKDLSEKKVAITFDDGPNNNFTAIVLGLLRKYEAKATFFCVGKNIESSPDLVKRIHEDGHSIGNHSYSHRNDIGFSTAEKWREEIRQTDRLIQETAGIKCRLFRPPFGVTTPNLAKAIKETGHTVIGWDIRTFDTTLNNPDQLLRKIRKKLKPGSIILLHDTHRRIPIILEQLLELLEQLHYKTVTIDDLLDEK